MLPCGDTVFSSMGEIRQAIGVVRSGLGMDRGKIAPRWATSVGWAPSTSESQAPSETENGRTHSPR